MNKNKQLFINLAASFCALIVNIGINFILSPFIVENVGSEAYGFVQLSNNLISYFSIITIALNSMSGRFISVSFFSKDVEAAKEYYSSSFYANLILSMVLLPVLIAGVAYLDRFINISYALVDDVKLLMLFMLINFIITMLCTNLSVSYYVKNCLFISSLINIIGYLLRVFGLLGLYGFLAPKIAYVGVATLGVTLFTQGCNIYFKKKLVPELYINKKYYHLKKVKELISAGIWNSITRIGTLLQEGLDLIIANLMISAEDMGVLALAKTVPTAINALLGTMISSFMPNLTELYANNRTEQLKHDIKQSMKIIGMIINIPIALLIGFGDVFYTLWVPSQDADFLQILSIITIFPWAVMGQATIIHNVFTIVNKIKVNSILVCITGLLNVGIVYFLLKNTSLGLIAVAGVSTVLSIMRNLLYTVPFGAIYIRCPWYTFYSEIGKSVMAVCITSGIAVWLKKCMGEYTWFNLLFYGIIAGGIGLIFNYYVVLNKEDRRYIGNRIRRKK